MGTPTLFSTGAHSENCGRTGPPVWQTPLLILSVLAILVVLVGAPIRTQLSQQVGELPQDFQYWPPDQQEQYYASQANKANPMFIYLFPALGALIGIWLSWFLLGSILHLALTLSGSRGNSGQAINLVAWASLPFALRFHCDGPGHSDQ